MALANQQLVQMINEIAAQLNSGECRRLLYLCGNVDIGTSATDVREMLKSLLLEGQVDYSFLIELVFGLKRFDILRKVFSKSKDEVERILGHKHVLSKYRILMADVSDDMANEDLKSVKFLLSTTLPREKMDKVKNFLDVVVELEKLDRVSPERVDLIEQCLKNIGRYDLAKKVNVYQSRAGTSQQQSGVKQQFIQQRLTTPIYSTPNSSPFQCKTQYQHMAPENFPVPERSWQHNLCSLDEYRPDSNSRNVCVIIDCVGNDGDMLENTFRGLCFTVESHKWLSVVDTRSTLRTLSRQMQNREVEIFVCCIISRGTTTDLLATDSLNMGLSLDSLRRLFSAEQCPMMAGKPKLFFIQRYSVDKWQSQPTFNHRDEDLEVDGPCGAEYIPTDADVFWSHCWTKEHQLERGGHHSVYLQALSNALQRDQPRRTLVDVHTEVNAVIYEHNRRNPDAKYHIDLKHTLRKNLFLK